MKKFYSFTLLLMIVIPLLEGCWNQRELTDLAFVMVLGVDKGTGNKRYDVTFQVVVPANVATGQNGGGGQGPPVVAYKSTGNTLTEASRKATKEIPRNLYYSHTRILVISEDVARDGILDLMDALDRDPEFRTTTLVVIAKDIRAEDMLASLTTLDKLPVSKFVKTLEATESMLGENIKVNIDEVLTGIVSSGKEPAISGFSLNGNAQKGTSPQNINTTKPPAIVSADGLAIFRTGKLVGWLTNEKVRGVVWVMNKMKGTFVDIKLRGKKDALSMTPFLSNTKISLDMRNDKPVMNVKIETLIKLSEVNEALDLTNPLNIVELEKKTAAQIKKEVEASIHSVQNLKADIFGFGEKIHRSNPMLWRKIKNDWNNQFARMDVNVKVHAYLRENGIRNNPFSTNMGK